MTKAPIIPAAREKLVKLSPTAYNSITAVNASAALIDTVPFFDRKYTEAKNSPIDVFIENSTALIVQYTKASPRGQNRGLLCSRPKTSLVK